MKDYSMIFVYCVWIGYFLPLICGSLLFNTVQERKFIFRPLKRFSLTTENFLTFFLTFYEGFLGLISTLEEENMLLFGYTFQRM